MKKLIVIFLLSLCFTANTFSQNRYQIYNVSKDIEVIKIMNNTYLNVSYTSMPQHGRIGSNGIIYINNGQAALFDTPMNKNLTKGLVNWIQDSLQVKIVLFVPNHWHEDCIGGLAYLNSSGIDSYANEMTIQFAKSKNLPLPHYGFKDTLTLHLGDKKIFCEYLGAAHTLDNIVVWLPSEKVLFAGCMVKELKSSNLGNTVDGDLKAYPETIKQVLEKFHNADIVIPGHGLFGGLELLKHTLDLCSFK